MKDIRFGVRENVPSQEEVVSKIRETFGYPADEYDIIAPAKVHGELHNYRSSYNDHRDVWKFKPVHANVRTVLEIPYKFVLVQYDIEIS